MSNSISLKQMLNNLRNESEYNRIIIDSMNKTLAILKKIVSTRLSLGITQRELAKKCGMKQPALARIESFKVIPKINTLITMAEAVGLNISANFITENETNVVGTTSNFVMAPSIYVVPSNNVNGDVLWTN